MFNLNKKALIFGVLNQHSIAYGIAKALFQSGAQIALTYQNESLRKRTLDIAQEFNSQLVYQCDVSKDEEIAELFAKVKNDWGNIDIIIHSVAFANREELQGDYIDSVTRSGFLLAQNVSSFSLTAIAKEAKKIMKNGSILTLSYIGSQKFIPNYNVMGIAKASLEASVRYLAQNLGSQNVRVNAISAGIIKTVSSSVIKDSRAMLNNLETRNPLKRNVTLEEIGHSAAFLSSDLASGITGEILFVDCGFHLLV